MRRFAMFRIVAATTACLAGAVLQPSWSQQAPENPNVQTAPEEPETFRSILESDIVPMEASIGVSGDTATQVDEILQDGVEKRLAVLDSLGIVYGQTPPLDLAAATSADGRDHCGPAGSVVQAPHEGADDRAWKNG